MDRLKNKRTGHGQILVLLAILIPLVIVFVGIAIDLGEAYVTKTTLSKAADAAALAAMRNLNKGQSVAASEARNAFNANYQSVPGLGTAVTPTVTWFTSPPCISGNTCVSVTATATVNNTFLRALDAVQATGNWDTTDVTVSATAQRNPLVMSLVLDRSGSMNLNGGAAALPGAVTTFISYFDEGIDNVADVSFSSADTVDVPMTTSFQSPINSAVESMKFGGATFAQAGLQDGFNQIVNTPVTPNVIRVVVFFTDGWANTNGLTSETATTATALVPHDQLNCSGTGTTAVNYGGCSYVEDTVAHWCGQSRGATSISFMDPTTGSGTSCQNSAGSPPTTFPLQDTGESGVTNSLTPLTTAEYNISHDATYRTEQLADTMRNGTNQITIYSIGLGNYINQEYLLDLANDPGAATYDSSQPQGQAVFAPTPDQLSAVFQTIASKVLLRLSQ